MSYQKTIKDGPMDSRWTTFLQRPPGYVAYQMYVIITKIDNIIKYATYFPETHSKIHSAPTGARNSSLGHPNMAEASLGKNSPNVILSLLHVFNGWYQELITPSNSHVALGWLATHNR